MWWYCMPVSFLVHVSVWYIVFSIHILFWFMFCIASPTVSPQCCMLRRFWAPTPDLASESDQLYSHVHSQSCWRVYPPTISIVLMCLLSHLHSQHQKEPLVANAGSQIKKGDCWKSFEILQKCNFKMCFLLIETRCCVQPCVSSCSSGSKKAQNWGFEITNVRYGHQGSFCRHFNDGSNSCFQTTNWNAAHGEWRRTFRNILN